MSGRSGSSHPAQRRYPPELKERAVRMVQEATAQSGESFGVITRVARQLGIGSESLRNWVKQAEIDGGQRPGTSTDEAKRIAELEREVRELRRANEILKATSAFFRQGTRPSTAQMNAFIDAHRDQFGVEPICRVMQAAPLTYYAARTRPPSARAVRDDRLKAEITRIYQDNYSCYGARKIYRQLQRDGRVVARCTVQRLMSELGIAGLVRGKTRTTTTAGGQGERPADLVSRNFYAPAPNRLWVADLTYIRTWSGWVYAAFVIDVYSRMVVGWQIATHLRTDLALDAVKMAIWRRNHTQSADLSELVHHSDRGAQYLSIRYTERLADTGAVASVGSRGDSYNNALAESFNGLFKAELIRRYGPWRSMDDVELATLEYLDWFNHRRLHTACGNIPPAEYEAIHYCHQQAAPIAAETK
ncbi:IS3 family transposase [Streptosporangium sp. NPDC006930]|uniref:IS3 family transposase n=1 Tax=Streptosporangium sp. NPDC006930 TaxID=3154783 RepID=UPI0034487E5F